jgi:hypothetical protein
MQLEKVRSYIAAKEIYAYALLWLNVYLVCVILFQ